MARQREPAGPSSALRNGQQLGTLREAPVIPSPPDLAHWNGGPSYLHRVTGAVSQFRSREPNPESRHEQEGQSVLP
jgi:hypothetical protein